MAGFAHVWNREHASSYSGQSVRQNQYPVTPNDLINAGPDGSYDFTDVDRQGARHARRALGRARVAAAASSVRPAIRPHVRTRLEYGTVRVLAEPIGTRRMDHVTLLDVRVEKGIRFPGGRRLAGFVDVFNVLNANPEQNLNWSSGSSFLQPLVIVPPRIAA